LALLREAFFNCGLDALDLSAGIGEVNWAGREFGDAPIGDARLSHRLVEIGADKAKQPGYCVADYAHDSSGKRDTRVASRGGVFRSGN
jgi:hypothetical protein